MKMVLAGVTLSLAGCAAGSGGPMVFDKDGATQADYNRSWAKCDYETTAATQAPDYGYRTMLVQEMDRVQRKRDLIIKCMAAEGFTLRR